MPQDPPAFRPYSPQDLSSTISGSPWSASPESGTNYDSVYVPDVDSGDDPAEYADTDQFFDSLPRLSSPGGTLPEPSASRSQEQQSPPSTQQEQRHLYQLSESPDPFGDLIDLTPPRSPSRPTTQQSRNTTRESSVVDLTESSPTVNNTNDMPPSRKRKADTPAGERPNKSSRGGAASGNLGGSPTRQAKVETPDLVDLVDIDDDSKYEDFKLKQQAELVKKQQQEEATRPVRLAEFQCIICMDNPTDLTVTHCGHLFCSECLHQALYAGNAKKCCPVCRTAINTTLQGKDKKQPKNGIFALEMKLMTASKKGKQPAKSQGVR